MACPSQHLEIIIDSDLAMDLPEVTIAQNPEDYLVKLDAQSILIKATQVYLKKNQRKGG